MPAVIPDYVNEARQGVQSAGQALQGYAGKEFTIGDELKKVLNEATTPGKTDWANIRSTALSDYLAAPQQARAMYRDPESEQYIFNPAQSSRVMSEYVQGSEIPFLTANTLFSMFTDQEKDLINSGVNAFKAQQAAAQVAYQTAQQVYSNLLDEFKLTEQSRIQDEQMQLEKDKFAFEKSKPRGSSADTTAAEIKQIIAEASKLPADKRSQYIQSQGYAPGLSVFEGVVPTPEKSELINLGDKPYQYTPSGGLSELSVPGSSEQNLLQKFFGFFGGGK